MQNSKWNYIAVGLSGISTLFGAGMHSAFFTVISLFLTVFNWYGAEFKRGVEEKELVKAALKAAGVENNMEDAEEV